MLICTTVYVPYDNASINNIRLSLRDSVSSKCLNGDCSSSHTINVEDVNNAICKLKSMKSDGVTNMMSDNLIHAPYALHVHLSLMFQALLYHGVAPDNCLLSTLIPIPKNSRKSLTDSANYRAIALGSVIAKVVDLIILDKSQNTFNSNNLQFGFKTKHSTSQCTFVLNEVIDYYNRHG